MSEHITFKLCVFGERAVGKTTLVRKYVTGHFEESTLYTLGVEISFKNIQEDKQLITLQMWDFAGEEQFRSFLHLHARGSNAGILIYDITQTNSLDQIEDWLKVFKKGVEESSEEIPILLVGSKHDLEDQRAIDFEQANKLTEKYNLLGPIECSSKSGYHIQHIFDFLSQLLCKTCGFD